MPKPARTLPGPKIDERPALHIVPPPAHGLHVLLGGSVLLVFVILLATASLHTMLVSGQRDLDGVNTRIRTETRRNEALEMKVARLESPERIVEAARADGMIDPETVTWLSPRPGGQTEQSVTERPASVDESGNDGTGADPGGDSSDVRAGSDTTDTGASTADAGATDQSDAAASEPDGGAGSGHEGDGSGA